jgi:hypothetical protein
MSINVYWASLEKDWKLASQPTSVYNKIKESNFIDKENMMTRVDWCPAVKESLKNTYEMKSLYNCSFSVDSKSLYVTEKNLDIFNKHFVVRSFEKRMFSFLNKYIFFTDSKSLNVTFYQNPFLEKHNIKNNHTFLTGKFDIGKWFRNTEFMFILNDNDFEIKYGQCYSYMTFHTDEEINFIQFEFNDSLSKYLDDNEKYTKKVKSNILTDYYKIFKNKKNIINEIKKQTVNE